MGDIVPVPADLVGKTIQSVDVAESVILRFTDGTRLEMNADWQNGYGGIETFVETYLQSTSIRGSA